MTQGKSSQLLNQDATNLSRMLGHDAKGAKLLYSEVINLRSDDKKTEHSIKLTNRERDIVALAARGLNNQDIADELGISVRTVKCTMHNACSKLGAQNRYQAVLTAIIRGYVALQDVISLDELANIFASAGSGLIESIGQKVKQKQIDELADRLAHMEPEEAKSVVQRASLKREQHYLPAVTSSRASNPSAAK